MTSTAHQHSDHTPPSEPRPPRSFHESLELFGGAWLAAAVTTAVGGGGAARTFRGLRPQAASTRATSSASRSSASATGRL